MQVLSGQYWQIFKSTYFEEHLQMAAFFSNPMGRTPKNFSQSFSGFSINSIQDNN